MTRNAAYSTLMTVHEMVLKIQARALGRDPLFMSPEELDALAKVRSSRLSSIFRGGRQLRLISSRALLDRVRRRSRQTRGEGVRRQ